MWGIGLVFSPVRAYTVQVNVSAYAEGDIMANGEAPYYGAIACNWLRRGTRVKIPGLSTVFIVKDKMSADEPYNSMIDIYMPSVTDADNWGVKSLNVEVLE